MTRIRINSMEKKFKVNLNYNSDKELYQELKNSGVPSLAKLLKQLK